MAGKREVENTDDLPYKNQVLKVSYVKICSTENSCIIYCILQQYCGFLYCPAFISIGKTS